MKRSTALHYRNRGPPSASREELIRHLEEEERATAELERKLDDIVAEKFELEDYLHKLQLVLSEAKDSLSEYLITEDSDAVEGNTNSSNSNNNDDDSISRIPDKEKEEKERKRTLKIRKKGKPDKEDDDEREIPGNPTIAVSSESNQITDRVGVLGSGGNSGIVGADTLNVPGELEVTVIKNWKKADKITIDQLKEMGEKAIIEHLSQKERKPKDKDKVKDKDSEKYKDKKSSKDMKELKKMVSSTIRKKRRNRIFPILAKFSRRDTPCQPALILLFLLLLLLDPVQ